MTSALVNRISWVAVAAGMIAAAIIFFTAPPPDDGTDLDNPLGNKRYLSEMRRIGGNANVLASDFRDWLSDQFQGRTLARTIFILTVLVVLGFRFVALPVAHASTMDEPDRGK
ncbi:MAG TPA: hypothetical protein VGM73_09155 [Candidatus Didemnitutus sp.]|jgi:hypothetical protein